MTQISNNEAAYLVRYNFAGFATRNRHKFAQRLLKFSVGLAREDAETISAIMMARIMRKYNNAQRG